MADQTARTDSVMRLWIDEVWHGGRLDLVPELVAPTYTRHEGQGTFTVTAEQYARRIRDLRERFPDLRYEIHDSAAVGDRFWIRYTFRGGPDSTGPWPKRPGLQLYRLENGKLAETWMLLRPAGTEWTDTVTDRDAEVHRFLDRLGSAYGDESAQALTALWGSAPVKWLDSGREYEGRQELSAFWKDEWSGRRPSGTYWLRFPEGPYFTSAETAVVDGEIGRREDGADVVRERITLLLERDSGEWRPVRGIFADVKANP